MSLVAVSLRFTYFRKKFEDELEEFRNEKKLEERRQRYYEHEVYLLSQRFDSF